MFLGHYAVGFAAKKWAPKISLGTLLLASLWLDILWPIFLLLDMEHVRVTPGATKLVPFDFYDYPLSHSLVMSLAWGAGFGLIYLMTKKKDIRGAWIIAGVVFSHWVLDFIVHGKDLPLLPAETGYNIHRAGLGLWNHPAAAVILELLLLAGGAWIYSKSTKALDKVGKVALGGLVVALALSYIADLKSTPPNNPSLIACMGLAQLLFVSWGYWIDDHRKAA